MNMTTHVTDVRVQPSKPAIKEFVLIPQHTTPANTTKELEALYDVLQDTRKMWKSEVCAELQSEHQRVRKHACLHMSRM